MSGTDALSIIIAALVLPFVAAIFTRPDMPASQKRAVAIAVAAVLGTLSAIVSGQIDIVPPEILVWITRVLGWVAAVAVAGQASYNLLKDPVRKVEDATTPKEGGDHGGLA